MPTLNDPTHVATSDYYPFVTMLIDRLQDVLKYVTKHDFYVTTACIQPLIANQDVEIIITNRENTTVKESSENMIRTLSRYIYEQLVTQYHDYNNVEHINVDIIFEKHQDSQKEKVSLFTHKGQKSSLVYNDNTTTTEDELRFLFGLNYIPHLKSWGINNHTHDRIKDYNAWFKNYPIDFATAKLISEAKQIIENQIEERTKW